MTRISAVAVLLCALASTLGAADILEVDVLNVVLSHVPLGSVAHGMTPAVLSDHTRGGGERFAEEWMKKLHGDVIGGEIASAFVEQNHNSEPVAASANFRLADVRSFEVGENYDWEKLNLRFPNVKSVVVVSRPAFDRLGSFALVRADMIGRGNAFTQFYDLERQPDGSWKIIRMTMGTFEPMHRADITISR